MKNPAIVKRGLLIFGVLLTSFIICEFIDVDPSLLALLGGIAGLIWGGVKPGVIFQNLCYRDIIFFTGLFVIVGAAEASGLLQLFGMAVVKMSFGNVVARCLLLMWISAFATAFLDCGPSTVLFLHSILSFKLVAPHNMYYWALSLGVLAGSCATMTGASIGTISANMLHDFLERHKLSKVKIHWKNPNSKLLGLSGLSFREYAKIGVPIALMFLAISSVYLTVIFKLGI